MSESIQKKLGRLRPPRVHLTYDVELGGAVQQKELPYVFGVIADLAGKSKEIVDYRKRKFTEVDSGNFNDIMSVIAPRVELLIDDHIKGSGKMEIALDFKCMDDFHPNEIINRTPEFKVVFDKRTLLNDTLAKIQSNENFEAFLTELLKNKDLRKKIQDEIGQ